MTMDSPSFVLPWSWKHVLFERPEIKLVNIRWHHYSATKVRSLTSLHTSFTGHHKNAADSLPSLAKTSGVFSFVEDIVILGLHPPEKMETVHSKCVYHHM